MEERNNNKTGISIDRVELYTISVQLGWALGQLEVNFKIRSKVYSRRNSSRRDIEAAHGIYARLSVFRLSDATQVTGEKEMAQVWGMGERDISTHYRIDRRKNE